MSRGQSFNQNLRKYELSSVRNSNSRNPNPRLRVGSRDTNRKSKICDDNKVNNFVPVFILNYKQILYTVLTSNHNEYSYIFV